MNRIAGRLWVKVFVKAHIRAVWNKLNNMTDYDDPSSAFESLIRLTSTDSSYCDLLGVMVDTISPESPMASWFLYHIIDLAALPSQHAIRRLSQELLSKCSPGGLARLRTRKRCRPTAALVWGVLASRLAGELSTVLFSEEVCDFLLSNIELDPDMICKVFSIIALEKFAMTGPCKIRIMQKPILNILREVASMSTFGLTDQEEIAGIRQAKFCAEWALRRVFYNITAEQSRSIASGPRSRAHGRSSSSPNPSPLRTSISSAGSTLASSEKSLTSKNSHIKVMLDITEASRHWKISEDGLMVRNDGSSFESIRATVSVTCGKWYYEVTVLTSGIMQLGWATPQCRFCPDEGTGVGDDLFGFSYDGCRNLLWANGESVHYGDGGAWRPGDVLGFYLDVDNSRLECFINGVSLGTMTPFSSGTHFQEQAAAGYFPAFSVTPLQQIELNFGASAFRYPPARPWRNLNDHGTLTPELQEAITKTSADELASKLHLDPETGLRVAIVTEQEIDYSALCSICCDHSATITLQPCGHEGFCVQCAYTLELCPMCRTRIFQRQMIPWSNESTDASGSRPPASDAGSVSGRSGLCISGVSEGFPAPLLNAQGDIVCSEASLQIPADRPLTAAEAAAHRLSQRRTTLATLGMSTLSSCAPIAENPPAASATAAGAGATEAAAPGGTEEPSNTKATSADDAFSPPSTAYFRFLSGAGGGGGARTSHGDGNNTAGVVHPFAAVDSSTNGESLSAASTRMGLSLAGNATDPLTMVPSRGQSSSASVTGSLFRDDHVHYSRSRPSTLDGPSLSPLSSLTTQLPIHALVEEEEDRHNGFREDHGENLAGAMDTTVFEQEQEQLLDDASPRSLSSLDSFGSGREASLGELMERGVPDFPDASALSSHRNSISASLTSLVAGGHLPSSSSSHGLHSTSSSSSNSSNSNSYSSNHHDNSLPPVLVSATTATVATTVAPAPLQEALPLPSPAHRPLPPLMPSQHALSALSPSSTSSAPLSFPAGHSLLHQGTSEPTSSSSSSSASRRSSLADDMRLLLQQQGILPAQPPQSPMVDPVAVMQQPRASQGILGGAVSAGQRRSGGAGGGPLAFEPFVPGGGGGGATGPLEQRVGGMSLREESQRPDSLSPLPTSASFVHLPGSVPRPSGRRASLPANRLEM